MPKTFIEFGEWIPDQGPFNNDGLWFARNVLKVGKSYERTPILFGTALGPSSGTVAPLGSWIHIKRQNKYALLFIGTSTAIYVTEEDGTPSWVDASGTSAPYSAAQWSFESFGPTVIATNGVDPIQGYSVDDTFDSADNFADLLVTTSPTTADILPKYVRVFKNHVFAANITMAADWPSGTPIFANGTLYPELVWWSDTDNATRFGDIDNSPQLKGSGWMPLYDGCGEIVGMATTSDVLFVFKERAIYRCDGAPFTFSPVSLEIGCKYPSSICALGDNVYFWSDGGPTRLSRDGTITSIGKNSCYRSLRESTGFDFQAITDSAATFSLVRSGNVWAISEPVNDLVLFFISTSDNTDTSFDDGDLANSVLIWNQSNEKMYYGRVYAAGVASSAASVGMPFRTQTPTINSVFQSIGVVSQNTNSTYYIRWFGGQNLPATADYSYFRLPYIRLGDGASRITKIRPVYDFTSTGGAIPTIRLSVMTKQTFSQSDPVPIVIDGENSDSGYVTLDPAPNGLLHSIGVGFNSTVASGVFRNIIGIEVEFSTSGVRGA